jgi:ABC-type branched-subunit amino acid transport system substrate-binding protein
VSRQVLATLQTAGENAPAVWAVIGQGDVPPVPDGGKAEFAGALKKAAADIGARRDARLRRIQLVNHIVGLSIDRSSPRGPLNVMLDELRRQWPEPVAPDVAQVKLVPDLADAWPNPAAMLAVLLRWSAQQKFWWWYWGLPGLGGEARWLRRQRQYLPPRRTFKAVLYSLILDDPAQRDEHTEDINRLATQAFLADVAAAYKPSLWRPETWTLGRRPALLIDRVDIKLAELLYQARAREGKHDPLLPVLVAADGPTGRHDEVTELGDPAEIEYPRANRPPLALAGSAAGALAIAVVVLLASGLIKLPSSGPGPHPTGSPSPTKSAVSLAGNGPCPKVTSSPDGETDLQAWPQGPGAPECVGFSTAVPFVNPGPPPDTAQELQDERTLYDQTQIFKMDANVNAALQKPKGASRGVIELAYFADLTEGPIEDYDAAEAEELEGLYAAQEDAWNNPEEPYLKIIVANGGSKMGYAPQVASMIVSKLGSDPNLLGVVGLDRSNTAVQAAVTDFTNAGIPMLATTVSADGPDGIGVPNDSKKPSPYFFSLSPSNTDEAVLMMEYIQQAVPHYFRELAKDYPSDGALSARQIIIYEPDDDNGDLYVPTLVADLKAVRANHPDLALLPQPTSTPSLDDNGLCSPSTVVIYAGRHDRIGHSYDDFTRFLDQIGKCYAQNNDDAGPFVIADDGISRFVADPADRQQLDNEVKSYLPRISYVTKGINLMHTGTNCITTHPDTAGYPAQLAHLCDDYAPIATTMMKKVTVGKQHLHLLWTGERVGLAYDAAQMFIQAAQWTLGNKDTAIHRSDIISTFENAQVGYSLASGSVQFSSSQRFGKNVPEGMPLAIVRINISAPDDVPTCEFPGQEGNIISPIPNMVPKDTACLGARGL